jgi:hypothetical protein
MRKGYPLRWGRAHPSAGQLGQQAEAEDDSDEEERRG